MVEDQRKHDVPLAAMIIIVFAAFSAGCTIWFVIEAAQEGEFYASFLLLTSLVFLVWGATILLQTKPAGGAPPTILITIALFLEAMKVVLLALLAFVPSLPEALRTTAPGALPPPATLNLLPAGVATFWAWISIVLALFTAFLTFMLAAFVSQSFDKKMADAWNREFIKKFLNLFVKPVEWLLGRRVTALCSSFASFLLVMYFLALAVAFDDRSSAGPALYSAGATAMSAMTAEPPAASAPEPETVRFTVPPQPVRLKVAEVPTTPPSANKHINVKFYFKQGKADFKETFDHCLSIQGDCSRELGNRSDDAEIIQNLRALCTASSWFEVTSSGQRQRILIVGHANTVAFEAEVQAPMSPGRKPAKKAVSVESDQEKRSYHSNSELAYARAQQIFLALSRIATAKEESHGQSVCDLVQWHVTDGASEAMMLKPVLPGDKPPDQRLSVEVQREVIPVPAALVQEATFTLIPQVTSARKPAPQSKPESPSPTERADLLDYLYFMIYTITTTGYGDLMPITPMTKFIVSIANLIEVMYLGMIFSVIIMKRPTTDGEPLGAPMRAGEGEN